MRNTVLEIQNLKISFRNSKGNLQVVRGVDTQLQEGKITGVLGESGSGKTVCFSSLTGLLPSAAGRIDAGRILFRNTNILDLSDRELRNMRGKSISYIFQNPALALNPYKSIGRQISKKLQIHNISNPRPLILETLRDVGLDDPELIYDMYPFQLSGGQSQRVMIAMGIILKPELLIADEPTSAVDSSLKKKILDLFKMINNRFHMSILLITHDFDLVKYLCHQVIVMYGGLILEEGSVDEILRSPRHPYTRELIRCTQSLSSNNGKLYSLPGTPLSPHDFSDRCPFYERCSLRLEGCKNGIPDLKGNDRHKVRCLLDDDQKAGAAHG